MDKKFIEWDFPFYEVGEESHGEKYIRKGHPSTFHPWWTRKPLASSRATNFASLIDLPESPEEREDIKELIKDITPWKAVKNGNNDDIKKAREMVLNQYETPPRVLDPFAGGGSIAIESVRLGCETYASDYNPIAVLIEKGIIEWPQKFGIKKEIPLNSAFESELKKSGYTKQQIEDIQTGSHKSLQEHESVKVNLLAHLVEKFANRVLEESEKEIGEYYPKENAKNLVGKREMEIQEGWIPVGYVWARTTPCQNPNCSAEIPLIKRFWLSKKENKKIVHKPIINEEKNKINFKILEGKDLKEAMKQGFNPNKGTVSNGNAECPICGQVTKGKQIKQISKENSMGERMIAVVFHHPNEVGKKYRIATEEDIKTFKKSKKKLNEKIENWQWSFNPVPDELIGTPDNREYKEGGRLYYNYLSIFRYGMTRWGDLFNPRQKLALITFMEKIKLSYEDILQECREWGLEKHGIKPKELTEVIMGYLSLIFSNFLNRMTTLNVWYIQGEKIQNTYSRQALPMMWSYVEIYPNSKSSGSWSSNIKDIIDGIKTYSFENKKSIMCEKNSADSLPYEDNSFDAIFTDPPYYDSVPYANLSDFFYVWLKRCIGDVFPDLFSTPLTPKTEEAIAELPLIRGMDKEKANQLFEQIKGAEDFEDMLSKSFKEMHRVLKPTGMAIIIYGYKTTKGWESMLKSLIKADFVITTSWPVRTEMKTRLKARKTAAIDSTIYMVCRKSTREEIGFWKDIKPAIKDRVEEKLQQFWNEGIVGGDFFISAIGPGMEIYSKYKKVEKYSGEKVTTEDLLKYIRSITTDYVVDTLLKDASPTEVDSASQFYIAYRWTYLDNKVEFDDARRIASGMGVELDNFSGDDGFVKQSRKYTSVLGPQDREEIERIDNMVDVMHKSVLLWNEGHQDEIKELLSTTGYGEKPAFWQFCQAVAETLMNGNKEKQLLEGFLMGREKYSKSDTGDEQTGLDQYRGK